MENEERRKQRNVGGAKALGLRGEARIPPLALGMIYFVPQERI